MREAIFMTHHDEGKKQVTPYGDTGLGKKQEVALMFDQISKRYDLLNHLLSFGIDKSWRTKAVNLVLRESPRHILDVATGTGDLAIAVARHPVDKVTGVDISEGMLAVGKKKIAALGLQDKIKLQYGDSEQLPFSNNTFDAAMVAFGVRNFENLDLGLREIERVLKPGARLVVLEFSIPRRFPVKQLYWSYFRYVLPLAGKLISKDKSAYSYLPESVKQFPDGQAFLERLQGAGFTHTARKPLTFGIASIYSGIKRNESPQK